MTGRDLELTRVDELRSARYQLPVYETITVAADNAHGVLDVMLDASDPDAARRALQHRYGFTEMQATAVMDMRRMPTMERQNNEQRREELAAWVKPLARDLGEA